METERPLDADDTNWKSLLEETDAIKTGFSEMESKQSELERVIGEHSECGLTLTELQRAKDNVIEEFPHKRDSHALMSPGHLIRE